jgi:hypothetical protein
MKLLPGRRRQAAPLFLSVAGGALMRVREVEANGNLAVADHRLAHHRHHRRDASQRGRALAARRIRLVGGILFRLFGILPGLESIAISLRDVVSAFTGSILFLVGLWFWQKRGA